MKFVFVAAYHICEMGLKPEHSQVTIYRNDEVHVQLMNDPSVALSIVDRQSALGILAIRALVGAVNSDPEAARRAIVEETVRARRKRYETGGFVVIEVKGHLDLQLPERCERIEDFWVCFHAYEKSHLNEVVHANVASALSAVRLAGSLDFRFEQVQSGSYLLNEDDQVVHSLSIDISGDLAVSQTMSDEQIAEMSRLIVPLRRNTSLQQSLDLHAEALNRQETKLRAFMAAWNSLELFVKEVTSARYEPLWRNEMRNPNVSAEKKQALKNISDNASKIARNFGMIAYYLGGARIVEDITEFVALKSVRNELSHELKDHELPTERVLRLLDRYLKAHLYVS